MPSAPWTRPVMHPFIASAFELAPRLNGRGYIRRAVAAPIKARMARLRVWLFLLAALPAALRAGATIEGRVPLPKTRTAPVMNRRYEIVAQGGVLSVSPPLG